MKKIAVAGTGYVGLSLAVLLAQNNEVTAVDILEEKVKKLNNWILTMQKNYAKNLGNSHHTNYTYIMTY